MPADSSEAASRLIAILRDLEQRGGARAEALRRADAPQATCHGLLFRLADYRLLTPVDQLQGVWPLSRALTTVPGTARWLLGVASNRGELLPLFDLRGLLLADYEGLQRRGMALILPGAERPFGVVVDAVIGLRRTTWQAPPPLPPDLPPDLAALITGISNCDDGAVHVVDLGAVERLPAFLAGGLGSAGLWPAPAAAPAVPA
jgi:chemotaxis signal transduction protein